MENRIAGGDVILGIESAIGQGGVAILCGGETLAESRGEAARAETLLVEIERAAAAIDGGLQAIRKIAVSTGPGSFTGLRIGIATVLGLARALGIPAVGVPLLEAIAESVEAEEQFAVAAAIGRSDVCFQEFSPAAKPISEPKAVPFSDFLAFAASRRDNPLIVESGLYKRLRETADLPAGLRLEPVRENLAVIIAKAAETRAGSEAILPIYVQSPRAVKIV